MSSTDVVAGGAGAPDPHEQDPTSDAFVVRAAVAQLPTRHGPMVAVGYRHPRSGSEQVALVSGGLDALRSGGPVLVRVHSECLTGDAFGSLRCDCGPQLDAALGAVGAAGRGVVVYLRGHEGRGIGLLPKLAAYALQEAGRDTLEANLDLGLPADSRDYAAAAGVLRDLGVEHVRLLTNNPAKVAALADHGVEVVERVPLVVGVGPENRHYLEVKRDRMGHQLDELGPDGPAGGSTGGPAGDAPARAAADPNTHDPSTHDPRTYDPSTHEHTTDEEQGR